ncbi:hypothetical protein M433DRAFT_151729 [Acidomyces richmondensis BFW]|nr:MAG: hypothetical protein FE78DRAFT_86158 [Acidomyces sp. 'richmondensis']KYG47859.1 hypothetical protein M433DRAFT_151729 [Acidomyces richmondensis BFW]
MSGCDGGGGSGDDDDDNGDDDDNEPEQADSTKLKFRLNHLLVSLLKSHPHLRDLVFDPLLCQILLPLTVPRSGTLR